MSAPAFVELARLIQTKGTGLGYRNADDFSDPRLLYSLKDRLLTNSGDAVIPDQNRFEIYLKSEIFNEAVRTDLFHGMVRIRRLNSVVDCLIENRQATAWILTTCYYASFFSAIELLRCAGRFVTYLDNEQTVQIQSGAKVSQFTLEAGTYEGIASYDSQSDIVTISFAKKNIRHHSFAWSEMKVFVLQTQRKLVGFDAIVQERLAQFIGSNENPAWPTPSDVRNHWNYEDASLFGTNGDKLGEEFRKIAASGSAIRWSAGKKHTFCKQNHASAIAFVCSILVKAIETVSGSFLPDSLTKKLPRC